MLKSPAEDDWMCVLAMYAFFGHLRHWVTASASTASASAARVTGLGLWFGVDFGLPSLGFAAPAPQHKAAPQPQWSLAPSTSGVVLQLVLR